MLQNSCASVSHSRLHDITLASSSNHAHYAVSKVPWRCSEADLCLLAIETEEGGKIGCISRAAQLKCGVSAACEDDCPSSQCIYKRLSTAEGVASRCCIQ